MNEPRVDPEREAWLDERIARARAGEFDPPPPEPVVVERCVYCAFVITAPLAEARTAFAEHDGCDRPRNARTARPRPAGFAIRPSQ